MGKNREELLAMAREHDEAKKGQSADGTFWTCLLFSNYNWD